MYIFSYMCIIYLWKETKQLKLFMGGELGRKVFKTCFLLCKVGTCEICSLFKIK